MLGMAKKSKSNRKSKQLLPKEGSDQLSMFDELLLLKPPHGEIIEALAAMPRRAPLVTFPEASPLDGVIEYEPDVSNSIHRPTSAQRENDFIMRRADKYEGRLYLAIKGFIAAFLFDVAVNGGLPVAQALLHKFELPLLNDRMLSGAFGLAAIVCAGMMIYFYVCFRLYNPQLWFDIQMPARVKYSWMRWFVLAAGSAGVGALAIMLAIVLYLSLGDVAFLITDVVWHISPSKWETVPN